MRTLKVREDRLRRRLARMGHQLQKSRARDPYDLTHGKFRIATYAGNIIGSNDHFRGYTLDLDGIEAWIITQDPSS
jgi:hypothetical protein